MRIATLRTGAAAIGAGALCAALLVTTPAPAAAGPQGSAWPYAEGIHGTSQQAQAPGPVDPDVKWSSGPEALGSGVGPGTPPMLLVDGHLLVSGQDADFNNLVFAVDRETGDVDWSLPTQGKCQMGAVGPDGTLWMVHGATDENGSPERTIVAVDPETGEMNESRRSAVENSVCQVVTANDGTVLLGSQQAADIALDPADASEKWRRERSFDCEPSGQPLVPPLGAPNDDVIYLFRQDEANDECGNQRLLAVDPADGSTLREFELPFDGSFAPRAMATDDGGILLVSGSTILRLEDNGTAITEDWTTTSEDLGISTEPSNFGPLTEAALGSGQLLVTANESGTTNLYGVSLADGSGSWTAENVVASFAGFPSGADGHAFLRRMGQTVCGPDGCEDEPDKLIVVGPDGNEASELEFATGLDRLGPIDDDGVLYGLAEDFNEDAFYLYAIQPSDGNGTPTDSDDDGLSDDEEAALETDPNNADTDDDGLNDGDEVNTHDTDPNDADTDDDGLNDGDEVNTHDTDPNDADADDGGVNDGDEVAAGTDPNDASDDDTGTDEGSPACPAGEVPEDGMTDVQEGSTHEDNVDCVVWWEVANGKTATTYAPAEKVGRDQMASFIARLLEQAGVTLPDNPEDRFDDDNGNTHEHRINQLAELGIVKGTSTTKYSPKAKVRREQMATFLVRAYEHAADTVLAASQDHFTDDDTSAHEDNINKAAEAGFTTGKTATTFAPKEQVNRAQMASFLKRVLDRLVQDGHASPPSS